MEIKAAIQERVDSNVFAEELDKQVYYFQKLKDLYDQFLAYDVSPIRERLENEIVPPLEERSNYFKTKDFLEKYSNEPILYDFLLLIVKIDTYVDEKAYNKKNWNEYPDKRRLSRPQTPMPIAIKFFIWLKISPDKLTSDHIFIRCLKYLQHPDQHSIIMSENHRKAASLSLWGENNGDTSFFDNMRQWFHNNIKYKITNPLNEPVFWSHALYHKDIKPLWLKGTEELPPPDDADDDSEENEDYPFSTLNSILYGPPGTGKTYISVENAIEIADYPFYKKYKKDRNALNRRFRELLINLDSDTPEGQIAFCTFHQSMSYEDFIEGIKSTVVKEGSSASHIKYEVKDGILKILSRMATDEIRYKEIKQQDNISMSDEAFKRTSFYKMSLGNTQLEDDDEIFDYCMENNCIALGWGEDVDYTNLNTDQIYKVASENGQKDFAAQKINTFINEIQIGNYVIISNGNFRFRAIGKVVGNYEYREDSPIGFHHFRQVFWLSKDFDLPVNDIYEKNFQQQTLYKLKEYQIKKEFFIKQSGNKHNSPKEPLKFVLIIDEINRGDVSKIFGELITLIEEDKRSGKTNEISTILPYSKKKFSLPPNLYIIGTMNTADRSVEALDTALRRRFSFKELGPDTTKIIISPEGINLPAMLDALNKRIEVLLDRDHNIGHAWLMGIDSIDQLRISFRDKIIPLFQEYFYNDYAKIGLILGNAFIEEKITDSSLFPINSNNNELLDDYERKVIYRLKDPMALSVKDFQSIYI